MNIVAESGNVSNSLQLKNLNNQKHTPYVNFDIAVRRNFRKQNGDYAVSFFHVRAYGQNAKYLSQYGHKGSYVEVSGSLVTNNFRNNKTGRNMDYTFIDARDASILPLSRGNHQGNYNNNYNRGYNNNQGDYSNGRVTSPAQNKRPIANPFTNRKPAQNQNQGQSTDTNAPSSYGNPFDSRNIKSSGNDGSSKGNGKTDIDDNNVTGADVKNSGKKIDISEDDLPF